MENTALSPQTVPIAVVIPCYKVRKHIIDVISKIGPEVVRIYVVDDCCPENTGAYIQEFCKDKRVQVIENEQNLGVGGAVIAGYLAANKDKMKIIVKIDGDGQMDTSLIQSFVAPILQGEADYTKGNRFFNLEKIKSMPLIRLCGNAVLSFMSKLSTGYWDLFDPTNGYTAIHHELIDRLPLNKVSRSYFFETYLLFRLNLLKAVVVDIPMDAKYGDEVSSLRVRKIIGEFLFKHFRNFLKRVGYNYYLRDMSLASIELPLGIIMLTFGFFFGSYHWFLSWKNQTFTSAGTVMISAIPMIAGLQFILAFFAHDIASIPKRPLQSKTKNKTYHRTEGVS